MPGYNRESSLKAPRLDCGDLLLHLSDILTRMLQDMFLLLCNPFELLSIFKSYSLIWPFSPPFMVGIIATINGGFHCNLSWCESDFSANYVESQHDSYWEKYGTRSSHQGSLHLTLWKIFMNKKRSILNSVTYKYIRAQSYWQPFILLWTACLSR